MLNSIEETLNKIEQDKNNLIDITAFIKALPQLKSNWVASYNAYEKTKNFGFSGYKKANPDDLDRGYSVSYKDLMKSVGITV